MYCENCGKLIEEGNKFCPYCGTKLVGTDEKVEEEISHEIRTDEIPEQVINNPQNPRTQAFLSRFN